MAQFQKPTPKPSCFPSFSRSSGKKSSGDPPPNSRKRRSTGCFSWLRFRVKKLPAKTVPMDSAVQEKANGGDQIKLEKLPSAGQNYGCHGPPVASEKVAKPRCGAAQNITLENRKNLDRLDYSEGATCPGKRKLESKRSRLSRHSSPENLTLTISPASPSENLKPVPARGRRRLSAMRHESSPRDRKVAGKPDTVVAMTIIMVTLAMMMICGRLCAVLFTSAWFYFVPHLRSSLKSNQILDSEFQTDEDSNSEELKRKVIMGGFLERNHRTPPGIL